MKRFWLIEGYESTQRIYDRLIPEGQIPYDDSMIKLLKRLASKYLSEDEIINASRRSNSKFKSNLLDVQKHTSKSGSRRYTLTTVHTPIQFSASIYFENELTRDQIKNAK